MSQFSCPLVPMGNLDLDHHNDLLITKLSSLIIQTDMELVL